MYVNVFLTMSTPISAWTIVGNKYTCTFCEIVIYLDTDNGKFEELDLACIAERSDCGCCGEMLEAIGCQHYADSDSD